MPRFNPDKIRRLVSELRRASGRLKALSDIDMNSFLEDPDKVGSAKYHLILAIEAAIDMCNHIISQNGYRAPEDYSDTFQVLYEQGAFGDPFIKDLKNMAKFRNRLIHIYWEVDDEPVYDILKKRLGDFKTFLDTIAKFLGLDKI